MSNLRTPIGTQCSCGYEFIAAPAPGKSRRYWRGWVRVVDELGGTTVCALCALSLIAKCEKGADLTVMIDRPQARTAPPESHANNINQGPWCDDLRECAHCGRDFHPDSSPNLFECWECDAAGDPR